MVKVIDFLKKTGAWMGLPSLLASILDIWYTGHNLWPSFTLRFVMSILEFQSRTYDLQPKDHPHRPWFRRFYQTGIPVKEVDIDFPGLDWGMVWALLFFEPETPSKLRHILFACMVFRSNHLMSARDSRICKHRWDMFCLCAFMICSATLHWIRLL